jgi:peptidoglycan/LPS O-acetylase OafA/YrhL
VSEIETNRDAVVTLGHGRNATVDAFRGLSVLGVLLYHYSIDGLGASRTSVWNHGRLGVEVFFVISGFVIAMTALRSRDWLDFALRRFARIYPTFLIACTLTFIVLQLYDPLSLGLGWMDYLASLTFAADRLGFKLVDGAYWSLFVEALFYVVVAASLLLLRKRFWIGVLALLIFGATARILVSKAIGVVLIAPYSGFFLLGMAGWYGIQEQDRKAAAALLAGSIVCLLMDPLLSLQWPAIPIALIMFSLLAAGVNRPFGRLAWLGRVSYPLYLLHQVLGLSLMKGAITAGLQPVLAFASAIAFSVVLAWLFHDFVEEKTHQPLLDKLRAFRPHPR